MTIDVFYKKQAMYSMVSSIEADFVHCFINLLEIDDIPNILIDKSKRTGCHENDMESVLRALDLQAYIEISNSNIFKLRITLKEKDFLNKVLTRIIPIRNKVMHPRILDFYDYPILESCFSEIDENIQFIEWDNVKKIKKILKNCPQKLPLVPQWLKKNEKIIENIPEVTDFDETSFIGRRDEISEIKQLLFKKNIHILCIIGDGGVGKTAIALKLLYDILDDENTPFELIIWVSLKTSSLGNFNFENINNSIKSVPEIYKVIENIIGDSSSIKDELIEISSVYKTLFVLDNLETINTNEIKDFLVELSENAKILITSRIGLGEMEYRYRLNGLNESDVAEYFDKLLELYGFEGRFTKKEKKHLAVDAFLSNPLALKWFVRGLRQGYSPENLIENKSDVINFCMSNVYEKLSDSAKKILDVSIILYDDLIYAELLYFLCFDSSDDIIIRTAINELIKSNFINQQSFSDNRISLSDFAREYLAKINLFNPISKKIIHEQQQRMNIFTQEMQIKINTNSILNVYCFRFQIGEKEKIVSAFYLNEALKKSKQNDFSSANELINLAEKITPNYFECNKVRGFLYSASNPTKARNEYLIAIEKAENLDEKLTTEILYASFLIRNNSYHEAIEHLEEILNNCTSDFELTIKFELIKAYSSCGLFDNAQLIVDQIDVDHISSIKKKNIFYTRKAEILKRKSESLDYREYMEKIALLKDASGILLESNSPDQDLENSLADILYSLSYYSETWNFILNILDEHYTHLSKTKSYKKFVRNARLRFESIENTEIKNKLIKYIVDINDYLCILKDNEGIVYSLKEDYGFIKNNQYPNGIYFKFQNNANYSIGDIISFKKIYVLQKGPMIKEHSIKISLTDYVYEYVHIFAK